MFGLFKKDPTRKLYKEYELLLEKARDVQRSGDLRKYADIMEKAEAILSEIDELKKDPEDMS